ncbi:hypothetical protein B0H11DRAFT_1913383 [Mycena galericulata]|nr:hypothetical protein B0H11DRAFT_1913383 [Mycena galericulata]
MAQNTKQAGRNLGDSSIRLRASLNFRSKPRSLKREDTPREECTAGAPASLHDQAWGGRARGQSGFDPPEQCRRLEHPREIEGINTELERQVVINKGRKGTVGTPIPPDVRFYLWNYGAGFGFDSRVLFSWGSFIIHLSRNARVETVAGTWSWTRGLDPGMIFRPKSVSAREDLRQLAQRVRTQRQRECMRTAGAPSPLHWDKE